MVGPPARTIGNKIPKIKENCKEKLIFFIFFRIKIKIDNFNCKRKLFGGLNIF